MLVTIEALDDIARRCLAGEGLSGEQMSWLGKSLRDFLAHRCHSIDEALGLKWGRGGVPWWLEKAIRRRDAALRELAHRFFGELSVSAQARAIRTLSIRYALRPGASTTSSRRRRRAMPARRRNGCGMPSPRTRRCRSASASCATFSVVRWRELSGGRAWLPSQEST